MSGDGDAYLSRLQRGWILAELLEGLRWQVAAFEQCESEVFVQRQSEIGVGATRGSAGRRGFRPLCRRRPYALLFYSFRIHDEVWGSRSVSSRHLQRAEDRIHHVGVQDDLWIRRAHLIIEKVANHRRITKDSAGHGHRDSL